MRSILLVLLLLPTPALADAQTDLGALLFFAPSLSVTGTQSCSSCHDPAAGFASSDPVTNQGGAVVEGAVPGRFGNRKPPSIAYQGLAPVFHHEMIVGAATFIGGDFDDGRATGYLTGTALADQALAPFLNSQEMAMPNSACVVLRACQLPGGLTDQKVCDIMAEAKIDVECSDPKAKIAILLQTRYFADLGFNEIARALASYERSPAVIQFTSRFDDWKAGRITLTDEEHAGFLIFDGKARCSTCHVLTPSADNGPPLFTNFTYSNIGLPKNPDNPWYGQAANKLGKDWLDKGLAVTLGHDAIYRKFAPAEEGKFKVPTLRNVDARLGADGTRAYGHNGYFKNLEGIVHFYNTRDLLPPCASDLVTEAEAEAQGCWPAPEMPVTVNSNNMGNLRLSPEEEAELVAFLKTLTDR